MNRDFDIDAGILFVQEENELDLHNDFNFIGLNYSIEHRTVTLEWRRLEEEWVSEAVPKSLRIVLAEVEEFRFIPRDSEMPFSEDDCISSIGYWVDEEWAQGVVVLDGSNPPEPEWPLAVEFMSGAVVVVQASRANGIVRA
ncbi:MULTISPECIES: hypothetical protein [unclassified Pseudoalteromonas]|uniref:hypothetical protein n=1 Tax=unclassified Pseudoalteromonas TaxID=194690 RepID=UPI0020983093|nr:hypothetical protein [Pseudoalteromonas sp. XMcav2-N]MCO7188531.1 hypothetical protein [Pseudoalteromonas sp. XMcav2-N]